MIANRNALSLLLLLCFVLVRGQEERRNSFLDLHYYYGTIMEHNPDLLHLITENPNGVIVSWNKRTDGSQDWHHLYNFPDYGVSFTYQDLKNTYLGENFGLYAHYNFYFFKRRLMFRVGQGVAYATNPYDKETNFRNNAYGSTLLSSTYMMLNYHRDRIWKRLGLNFGVSLIHYSNANVKAPNTSTNSIVFNLGANYDLDSEPLRRERREVSNAYTEPVGYNLVLRGGVNESDIVGSGQYPFVVGSFYADKRINLKSALQAGVDVFFSEFLIEYNRYRVVSFFEEDREADADYRRIGLFLGHELFLGKTGILSQMGYYVYNPIEFENDVYLRLGLKRYFRPHIFGAVTLKSHWAKAEAVELGIGYRW
ncbi:acyloxyacyl hydrolase [Robertkochia sediminum]|uniref:acyloxyacyl hydrolase n=1 Tax=Robertkochia sediminum TaxID=2785326 RepID=UPI0019334CD5|nr:acyloxyacyl hydrolase [Robertkochia sediminum]MBL7472440.1 acyloxyacyl hydrolase [Robertkochia sediminum]